MKTPIWFNAPATEASTGYGNLSRLLPKFVERVGGVVVDDPAAARVQVNIGTPEWDYREVYERRCPRVAWYTMFESDRPLPSWCTVLNDMADALIAPSQFCADGFRKEFTAGPVFVVGHGVDLDEYSFVERPPRDRWQFLWTGDHPAGRKNGTVVDEVFRALDLPGSDLVLKWTHSARGDVRERTGTDSTVRYLCQRMSVAELCELFIASDVFVWPTSAEGFGLPPIEAGATGLPVIVTAWGSMLDYLDTTDCYLLAHRPRSALPREAFGDDLRSVMPDRDNLAELMRWTYDHRDEARARGRRFAARVASTLTWEHAARQFLSVIAALTPEDNPC